MEKDIIEQRKKMLEEFRKFRENNIPPASEFISKAINDEEFTTKTSQSITIMIDGKPVNKNPLLEIPMPEMRLYFVDENYFESIDELLMYCRINKISTS